MQLNVKKVKKMSKNTRIIIQIVLGVGAVVLSYLLYESIMEPVRFNEARAQRETLVVQRLKDIRTAEIAFKDLKKYYCGDVDSLISFLDKGRIPVVKKIGDVPDSMTEAEALKKKIISRDTVYEDAFTALFPYEKDKAKFLATLPYIPYTDNQKKFIFETGSVLRSNISMPVIMVSAPFETYLNGLEEHLLNNIIARAIDLDRYPGMKFGSMDENITDGNWE